MKDISLTYLGGCGFLVWYGDTGFLFDASTFVPADENESMPEERILPDSEILSQFSRLFVFISSHDPNNYDPDIYTLLPDDAKIFLGFDLPVTCRGTHMNPGDEIYVDGLTVHAYDSTDQGVSFLLRIDGITMFHAGNLNLWHWRDQSTITEIEAAEQAFYDCIAPIMNDSPDIDVAFFPVDPRQGSMYDAGAGYFLMNLKPRVMIPMFFQGRPDVALQFAVTNENDTTKVIALQHAGDNITVSIPESDQSAPNQKLIDFLRENPVVDESDYSVPKYAESVDSFISTDPVQITDQSDVTLPEEPMEPDKTELNETESDETDNFKTDSYETDSYETDYFEKELEDPSPDENSEWL